MTVTATVTVTTVVGITGTATTDAALSPSAATTDLFVELAAATKYHRRTTARARPSSSAKGCGCGVRYSPHSSCFTLTFDEMTHAGCTGATGAQLANSFPRGASANR